MSWKKKSNLSKDNKWIQKEANHGPSVVSFDTKSTDHFEIQDNLKSSYNGQKRSPSPSTLPSLRNSSRSTRRRSSSPHRRRVNRRRSLSWSTSHNSISSPKSCECPSKIIEKDVGIGVTKFRPQPGDIIILQNGMKDSFPKVSQGYVKLYLDDYFFERTLVQDQQTLDENYSHDFLKGDIVLRMGTFDKTWKWHPGEVIQVFVCENKHFWYMAAQIGLHPLGPPLHGKVEHLESLHMTVNSPYIYFRPRDGDLIMRGLPGIENLNKWDTLWWYPTMETKLFDMLVRANYHESHNSTNVTVEMYWLYDTLHYWIFVGRDTYTYSSHNSEMTFAYIHNLSRSELLPGWQHVQDVLRRKSNKTLFLLQKPGKQKRVLDQPFDHHLPKAFDHLGFDDLAIK